MFYIISNVTGFNRFQRVMCRIMLSLFVVYEVFVYLLVKKIENFSRVPTFQPTHLGLNWVEFSFQLNGTLVGSLRNIKGAKTSLVQMYENVLYSIPVNVLTAE